MKPHAAHATLVLVGLGCATAPPYNPFQVPRHEFEARIRTIAVAHLVVPSDLEDPEAVAGLFEPLIVSKLEQAGLRTVDPDEVEEIWDRMAEQVGGYFDPMTGQRDQEAFDAVRLHTFNELEARFEADAVLHPTLLIVMAKFSGGTAHWCGASQGIQTTGRWVLEAFAGSSSSGTIAASCLGIQIEDTKGVTLYQHQGGIEILAELEATGFDPHSREELFLDAERNRSAVSLALDDLLAPDVAARGE
jgi:hypothetical protein